MSSLLLRMTFALEECSTEGEQRHLDHRVCTGQVAADIIQTLSKQCLFVIMSHQLTTQS